jgi:hypothetical protein
LSGRQLQVVLEGPADGVEVRVHPCHSA